MSVRQDPVKESYGKAIIPGIGECNIVAWEATQKAMLREDPASFPFPRDEIVGTYWDISVSYVRPGCRKVESLYLRLDNHEK